MMKHWTSIWWGWYRLWQPEQVRLKRDSRTNLSHSRPIYVSDIGACLPCKGFGVTNDTVCNVCGGIGRHTLLPEWSEPRKQVTSPPLDEAAQLSPLTLDDTSLPASHPDLATLPLRTAIAERDAMAAQRDQACGTLQKVLDTLDAIKTARHTAEARATMLEVALRQAECELISAQDTARRLEQDEQAWHLVYQHVHAESRRLREAALAVMPSEEELEFYAAMLDLGATGIEPSTRTMWRSWLELAATLSATAETSQESSMDEGYHPSRMK